MRFLLLFLAGALCLVLAAPIGLVAAMSARAWFAEHFPKDGLADPYVGRVFFYSPSESGGNLTLTPGQTLVASAVVAFVLVVLGVVAVGAAFGRRPR